MMQVLTAMGGVGLFLLGMEIMTAALREAAGGRLRRQLARGTASPLRGAVAGAGGSCWCGSACCWWP